VRRTLRILAFTVMLPICCVKFFCQSVQGQYGIFTGKSSVSELHFFLNIMKVVDNTIIKKGIHYLLGDRKSTAKSVYYLQSRSVNDRRHSLKLKLKFRYRTFSFLHPKYCHFTPTWYITLKH